jgi:pimeloyl-ACP methyl ester carboxylesterase
MAPVARELSADWSVLEPLQTAASLEGQVEELREILEKHAELPVTLVGSSWGAMLSYLSAARYPALVKKVILIGSAVFEERYAANIQETRLNRLCEKERVEVHSLIESLNDPSVMDKSVPLARLGALFTKADAYNPLTLDSEVFEVKYHIHKNVWDEAQDLRRSGKLLELGKQIQCPVMAIHGDYDPHPPEGIQKPLSAVIKSFRFILLENCGHLPWIEMEARDKFYELLREELR